MTSINQNLGMNVTRVGVFHIEYYVLLLILCRGIFRPDFLGTKDDVTQGRTYSQVEHTICVYFLKSSRCFMGVIIPTPLHSL